MNPIIKFTTLFGLLAVELAEEMKDNHAVLKTVLPPPASSWRSVSFTVRSTACAIRSGVEKEPAPPGPGLRNGARGQTYPDNPPLLPILEERSISGGALFQPRSRQRRLSIRPSRPVNLPSKPRASWPIPIA